MTPSCSIFYNKDLIVLSIVVSMYLSNHTAQLPGLYPIYFKVRVISKESSLKTCRPLSLILSILQYRHNKALKKTSKCLFVSYCRNWGSLSPMLREDDRYICNRLSLYSLNCSVTSWLNLSTFHFRFFIKGSIVSMYL